MATSTSTSQIPNEGPEATTQSAPFTEQTVSAAHEAIDRLSARVARTEQQLRGAASQGQEQWSERQEELRAQFEGTWAQARDYAQENPMAAAGIAFGAGFIIANLLRR